MGLIRLSEGFSFKNYMRLLEEAQRREKEAEYQALEKIREV